MRKFSWNCFSPLARKSGLTTTLVASEILITAAVNSGRTRNKFGGVKGKRIEWLLADPWATRLGPDNGNERGEENNVTRCLAAMDEEHRPSRFSRRGVGTRRRGL